MENKMDRSNLIDTETLAKIFGREESELLTMIDVVCANINTMSSGLPSKIEIYKYEGNETSLLLSKNLATMLYTYFAFETDIDRIIYLADCAVNGAKNAKLVNIEGMECESDSIN
jgi:hypothetical protein